MTTNTKRLIWNLVALAKWKFCPERELHSKILLDIFGELEVDLFDLHQDLCKGRSEEVHVILSEEPLLNNENYFKQICSIQNMPHRFGHLQAYGYEEFFRRYCKFLYKIEDMIKLNDGFTFKGFLEHEFGIYIPVTYLIDSKAYKCTRS